MQTIVKENHPALFFFIVLEGRVEISIVDKKSLSAALSGKNTKGKDLKVPLLAAKKGGKVVHRPSSELDLSHLSPEEQRIKRIAVERAYVKPLGEYQGGGKT